jgi:hypothetical protein
MNTKNIFFYMLYKNICKIKKIEILINYLIILYIKR